MRFVKMHGCGNDYIYLDGVGDAALAGHLDSEAWSEQVRRMSDRHKGIGSDGVIVLCRPRAETAGAHVRMRMFNADGSESEMCGNGIRCVAKYAHDRLGVRTNPMLVETGRGVLSITYETAAGKVVSATVDMGEPILELERVPIDAGQIVAGPDGATIRGVDGIKDWRFVSMGNPHAISFSMTPENERRAVRFLGEIGPGIESHAAFPNRTNVHFLAASSRSSARVYTWERGAGVTQACGTGVCASVVAGVLAGRLDREVRVRVLGGELFIRWDERSNHVFMSGEAVDVFEGDWPLRTQPSLAREVVLHTERLLLRPFVAQDAVRVQALAGDRRIAEMTLTVPHPYELHHAESWIALLAEQRWAGAAEVMAVCERDGTLVGAIGLEISKTHERAELGYWIGSQYWGRGYATEASLALIRHGFTTLGLNRINSCHFAKNPASGRVLEKAGLKREGLSPKHVKRFGEYQDVVLFGLSRDEWETASATGS